MRGEIPIEDHESSRGGRFLKLEETREDGIGRVESVPGEVDAVTVIEFERNVVAQVVGSYGPSNPTSRQGPAVHDRAGAGGEEESWPGGAGGRLKLVMRKISIEIAPTEEGFVIADVDDPAAVHDGDAIGIDDGAEAVGNDEGGAAEAKAGEGLVDPGLGVGVDLTGSFVED
jgi:hypothetical protein